MRLIRAARLVVRRASRSPVLVMQHAAFYVMVIGIPLAVVWDVAIVAPSYFNDLTPKYLLHLAIEVFFFANIFGNVYYAVTEELSGRCVPLSAEPKPDWRFCDVCERSFPPRSYHCRKCNVCTLVRDHHCVFTGTCISFRNYRYFMATVFHVWVGTVYASLYHLPYCIHEAGFMSVIHILCFMFPPMVMMISETSSPYGTLALSLQLLAVLVFAFTSFLLVTQTRAMLKGQTRYENKHNIRTYDRGWRENVRAVMGTRWHLVWLSPTIESPLPGDGINFKCRTSGKDN